MLRKMYLTNFLSFKERTEFDFTASKYSILSKTNVYRDVLKGALAIGPNAAGKTNMLYGISFIIKLFNNEEPIILSRYKCLFSENPVMKVEYEFLIDESKVEYEIHYDIREKNIKEMLKIDNKVLLDRNGSDGKVILSNAEILDDKVDNKTLFLRVASFNTGRFPQEPILNKFVNYIQNSYVIMPNNPGMIYGFSISEYAEKFGVEKINNYLEAFGYDFFIEYGSQSEGEGIKIEVGTDEKMIFFKRKSFPFPNVFPRESMGNKVFASILPSFINILEYPGMLVIDEFGNSLHNKLTESIITFFMNKSKDSQLFITSHHTNLISNSVFRPDQINLITFNGKDGSTVERISMYGPREAQNMEKMYLGGMFEGLPLYG